MSTPCAEERPALNAAALRRRLLVAAVALVCGLAGLGLAGLFGLTPQRWTGRVEALAAIWFAPALGLAFEPDPRGTRWRTAAAVVLAALVGAALALAVCGVPMPYSAWGAKGERGLGELVITSAWLGAPLRAALVGAAAALPGPLLLLAARRLDRQLEWQAAAAALGAALVGRVFIGPSVGGWGALSLAVTGLPLAFAAYLLDRRAGAPSSAEVDRLPRAAGLVVACAALAVLVGWAAPRLLAGGSQPGCPTLEAVLEDLRARQARHVARTGAPARDLAALEGVTPDLAGGYAHGHVLRYARLEGGRWVVAADPVPARAGWPSLRLVGPDGPLERGLVAFPLEAP
ncbi:MAG: hypothetical protein M9894_13945 [Planctomycetes bacterium]|nr:hypothetical protein [Planctomycetota bacterium]